MAERPTRLNLPPATISADERRRVNLAHGFAPGYPILLLDEPTASLDDADRKVAITLIAGGKAAIIGTFRDLDARNRAADCLFEALPIQDAA
ncbi:hypothetical protein [Roseomonas marmotae]|uniref:ATP-binding cassette domain-containing protein n=1 Tax=Roseomonas marmotae TaxID=2768161 RepID=A0ABS3KC74_9PROT|nr:hypothetical protein [Roseomonas marmotae]MBO1074510.1 hypothetical protein [Roseomonas marmotae]QTI78239.1 hypothetical protein IAI58_11030 [Roseomonas marmotae]